MPDIVGRAAIWFGDHPGVRWAIILFSIFAMLAIVGFNVFVESQKGNCSTACKSRGYDHSEAQVGFLHQQCVCYRGGPTIKDW